MAQTQTEATSRPTITALTTKCACQNSAQSEMFTGALIDSCVTGGVGAAGAACATKSGNPKVSQSETSLRSWLRRSAIEGPLRSGDGVARGTAHSGVG